MIVGVKKIGNSQGIILPKQLMAICSIKDRVSVTVENNHIVISATDNPREGWSEQFKSAFAAGDVPEQDIFGGTGNDFDKDEWVW